MKTLELIEELQRINKQEKELFKRRLLLTAPVILDFEGTIEKVISAFNEYCAEERKLYRRRMLIFICFRIYFPAVFVGDRIPHGFRKTLNKVLQIKDPSLVSHNIKRIAEKYVKDGWFRSKIDEIYDKIIETLKIHKNG